MTTSLKIPLMYNVSFRDHFCIRYCRFWLMTLMLVLFGALCVIMIPKILHRNPTLVLGRTEYAARVQPQVAQTGDFGSSSPEFDTKQLNEELDAMNKEAAGERHDALHDQMPEYLQNADKETLKQVAGNWLPAVGERNPNLPSQDEVEDLAGEVPKKSRSLGKNLKAKNRPLTSAGSDERIQPVQGAGQHLIGNFDYNRDVTFERRPHRHQHRKSKKNRHHHGHDHRHHRRDSRESRDEDEPENFNMIGEVPKTQAPPRETSDEVPKEVEKNQDGTTMAEKVLAPRIRPTKSIAEPNKIDQSDHEVAPMEEQVEAKPNELEPKKEIEQAYLPHHVKKMLPNYRPSEPDAQANLQMEKPYGQNRENLAQVQNREGRARMPMPVPMNNQPEVPKVPGQNVQPADLNRMPKLVPIGNQPGMPNVPGQHVQPEDLNQMPKLVPMNNQPGMPKMPGQHVQPEDLNRMPKLVPMGNHQPEVPKVPGQYVQPGDQNRMAIPVPIDNQVNLAKRSEVMPKLPNQVAKPVPIHNQPEVPKVPSEPVEVIGGVQPDNQNQMDQKMPINKQENPQPEPGHLQKNKPNFDREDNGDQMSRSMGQMQQPPARPEHDHEDSQSLPIEVDDHDDDVKELAKLFHPKLRSKQHAELVETIRACHNLLRKSGLTYFLHGRSLLGYYRHAKSIIPWDDKAEVAILATDPASKTSPEDFYWQFLQKQMQAFSDYALEKSADSWRTLLFRKKAVHQKSIEEPDGSQWHPEVRITIMFVKTGKTLKPIFDFLTNPPTPNSQAVVQFDGKATDPYAYENVMPLQPAIFESTVETFVPNRVELILRTLYKDLAICETEAADIEAKHDHPMQDMHIQVECSQLAHLFPMTNLENNAVLKAPKRPSQENQ